MKFKNTIILAVMILFNLTVQADEGMWLPSLLSKMNLEKMNELGVELTADDIYNINNSSIKDAVIALNGGSCTGELVSGEGLFLTNHHCGYGQIQTHSTEEKNILRDGFWAQTKADELPNKGMYVSFLIRVEDVTDRILGKVNSEMTDEVKQDSISIAISDIVEEATTDNHYEAKVKSFFSENQYLLMVYERYNDVRLVGAPPHFIGKFGGDTDNWMWPRHTGDFSIFRIYSGPDGKPADYSEENIPMKPRHFFPISLNGYKEGDFSMVLGYPGSTNRYLTSDGVNSTMKVVNECRINFRKAKLDIISDYMSTSDKATIQYATKYARSSNYYKYSIGQNRGLKRLNVVNKKQQDELAFNEWVNSSIERKEEFGDALAILDEAYENIDDDMALYSISEAFIRGPEIFSLAHRFEKLANLLDGNADSKKIDEAVLSLDEFAKTFFKDYNSNTDQKIVAALTEIYANKVVEKYQPDFIQIIKSKHKGDYDGWAEKIFRKSFLNNEDAYMAFLRNPKLNTLLKDPIYNISTEIYKMNAKVRIDNEADNVRLDKGYHLYMKGLLEMNKEIQMYPNANSTMRLTYGSVGGYDPVDAVEYSYYTTIKGYIEKEIPGDREFDVWPRMKELYYANKFGNYSDEDGTLHTCFVTNNDITGGNSGSPVLNSKGELIGIAFDGNWEAMSGDIAFEPELQKCINVDIRYVLWVIDTFAGASHLVDEMKLVK